MVNKQNLPDKNYFLENRSIIETWLSTPLDGGQSKKEFELCVNINQKYPYKNKIFDTGALLYMWCQEKNMNWLSFLTRDCKNYNSKNIMANKPYERIGSKNLAFHLCGGSFDQFDRKSIWEENKKTMLEEYKKSEEEYNASKNVFVY